jgi:uncharacterized phage-like protein YoqJ
MESLEKLVALKLHATYEITRLQKQNALLQVLNNDLKLALQDLREDNDGLRALNEVLRAENAALRAENEALKHKYPLTVKQINALPEADKWWTYSTSIAVFRMIRAVERAHGITAAKEGTE